jgi:hypothetical protein
VIGQCRPGWKFEVLEHTGVNSEHHTSSYGGYLEGAFDACGWIESDEGPEQIDEKLPNHCPGLNQKKSTVGTFYEKYNGQPAPTGDGYYIVNKVPCKEYANFRPWSSESVEKEEIRTVPAYALGGEHHFEHEPALKWRYVTEYASTDGSGKYIMVRDTRYNGGEGNWVFVPLSCLRANASELPTGEGEYVPSPPTVATGSATYATPNATLSASVNPNSVETKYFFEYGTTESYGSYTTTENAGSGTGAVTVYAPITGLAPGTTYYYRIVASSATGESVGGPESFTTQPPPTATTSPASSVQEIKATLNASVNPNGLDTHYYFEYGTTTSYGSYIPAPAGNDAGAGTASLPESATVTNLLSGTTYHYRVVASSSAGTTYGADQTLTTEYEQSSSRWVDYDPATGETGVYYRNSSGAMAWWQWQPVKGWGSGVLGGAVASGTTPAVLYEPNSGETSAYYQNSNHEVAFWQWQPVRGWGSGVLGGHEAPNTNPAVVVNWSTPETTVYYQNSSGEVAFWQWHLGKGWESGVLGGHAAAGSTPAVVYTPSTGETSIYYQNSNHEVAFWQWQPGRGWGSGTLGGHEAANTSPTVVDDQATGEPSVYYQDTSGAIAWWQWHQGKGWENGLL